MHRVSYKKCLTPLRATLNTIGVRDGVPPNQAPDKCHCTAATACMCTDSRPITQYLLVGKQKPRDDGAPNNLQSALIAKKPRERDRRRREEETNEPQTQISAPTRGPEIQDALSLGIHYRQTTKPHHGIVNKQTGGRREAKGPPPTKKGPRHPRTYLRTNPARCQSAPWAREASLSDGRTDRRGGPGIIGPHANHRPAAALGQKSPQGPAGPGGASGFARCAVRKNGFARRGILLEP